MDRKIYEDLVAWKNTENHKTLMVLGVRQCGKTYIIDEFCKKEYKYYKKTNHVSISSKKEPHNAALYIFNSNIDISAISSVLLFL